MKYVVSTRELEDDVDGGEAVIKQFQEEYNKGTYTLSSLYQKLDNEQLATIPEIAKVLRLKGYK